MKTGKDGKQYNFVDDRKEEGFVAEYTARKVMV